MNGKGIHAITEIKISLPFSSYKFFNEILGVANSENARVFNNAYFYFDTRLVVCYLLGGKPTDFCLVKTC